MRSETIDALKKAACVHLDIDDLETAYELLSLALAPEAKVPATPVLPPVAAPPAVPALPAAVHGVRDYHWWTEFIESNYIPYLASRNQTSFTSKQILTWIESCPAVELSHEELDPGLSDRPKWRSQVGNALTRLVELDTLKKAWGSKVYSLKNQTVPMIAAPTF